VVRLTNCTAIAIDAVGVGTINYITTTTPLVGTKVICTFVATATSMQINIRGIGAATRSFSIDNWILYKQVVTSSAVNVSVNQYRYGHNAQEKDNEIYGNGNAYTAEFWEYDVRTCRRWNVDPMSKKYPGQSPYATFNNNPIYFSDLSGREGNPPWWTWIFPNGACANSMQMGYNSTVSQNSWAGKFGGTIVNNYSNVPMSMTQAIIKNPGDAVLTYSPIGGAYSAFKIISNRDVIYQNACSFSDALANGNPEAWGHVVGTLGTVVAGMGNPEIWANRAQFLMTKGFTAWKNVNLGKPIWAKDGKVHYYDNNGNLQTFEQAEFLDDGAEMIGQPNPTEKKVWDAIDYAAQKKGGAQPGYKGGGKFDNDGSFDSQILPEFDSKNNPITYKKYDVFSFVKGINRGALRVIIGSDGSAYFTNNHYKTFTKLK
jgi:hypothetical protein